MRRQKLTDICSNQSERRAMRISLKLGDPGHISAAGHTVNVEEDQPLDREAAYSRSRT